jgi:hypothetical protein
LLLRHTLCPSHCSVILSPCSQGANVCYMDKAKPGLTGKLPNGRVLDSMASIYAHELAEVVATPFTDSW